MISFTLFRLCRLSVCSSISFYSWFEFCTAIFYDLTMFHIHSFDTTHSPFSLAPNCSTLAHRGLLKILAWFKSKWRKANATPMCFQLPMHTNRRGEQWCVSPSLPAGPQGLLFCSSLPWHCSFPSATCPTIRNPDTESIPPLSSYSCGVKWKEQT